MLKLILIPFLGAIIGWITNKIAIYLIFRPYQPYILPIIKYPIQGMIPKRQRRIAADIGNLVEKDLLPLEDLLLEIKQPKMQEKLTEGLAQTVYEHLIDKISIPLPSTVKNILFQQIKEVVNREAPAFFDKLLTSYTVELTEQISLSQLVQKKVEEFDLIHLEKIIIKIVSKELKHIELLGAILGFIIGLLQTAIVLAIN